MFGAVQFQVAIIGEIVLPSCACWGIVASQMSPMVTDPPTKADMIVSVSQRVHVKLTCSPPFSFKFSFFLGTHMCGRDDLFSRVTLYTVLNRVPRVFFAR